MIFEEQCDSCGRYTVIKYCKIKKLDVCYNCCLSCNYRDKCEIRVWFKELKVTNKGLKTREIKI